MEEILRQGLDLIRAVQSFASPPLTLLMLAVTSLGSLPAYMILLPLVYWCFDEKKGSRLALAVLFSAWLNLSLKFLLDQPRPFFAAYDPAVGFVAERFGGFPSGHAQTSLVMFFIIASWLKKKRYRFIAALLCLLIGFSRVYLGVHFPTDVFGGWILGGLITGAYFLLEPRLTKFFEQGGPRVRFTACAAAAFLMILYKPSDEVLMPAAAFLGMGLGCGLNKRFIGFKARGNSGKSRGLEFLSRGGRFLTGAAGMFLLLFASEKLLPGAEGRFGAPAIFSANYRVFYFLRFALIGLWNSAAAPALFLALGLAGKNIEPEETPE
ncbi:MAG: phosphatase PAP2 family protein [Treponema sp.]|jgi:membrane-associated phospholipid phosphatase|nr:phosphatase PAP2 family protein [Treponema sp.]